MGTEIEKAKTLEERVREKIHASIGDLITEDDIAQMVERGVEEALFQPRKVTVGDYGRRRTVEQPSVVTEIVHDELKTQMREAVDKWIADNDERFTEAVQEVVREGVGQALLGALEKKFSWMMTSIENQVTNGNF